MVRLLSPGYHDAVNALGITADGLAVEVVPRVGEDRPRSGILSGSLHIGCETVSQSAYPVVLNVRWQRQSQRIRQAGRLTELVGCESQSLG